MSWQEELQKGIRTAAELAGVLGLSPEEEARYAEIIARYPMMITPYYLSLADLSDPDDPILKMCLPSPDELAPGGSLDTSGEADNTVLEGVQHKYKPTALMLSTNRCAMYCRHCFRKRLVGLSEAELNKRVDDAVNYLRAHKEVSNILISGGDSFMNSNRIIERYLHDLSQIDHLDFIRFGSRIPVTLPERIYGDSEFLDLFAHYAEKKAVYLVTQFNHPRELTEESLKAIRAMTARGVAVKNQTVLLRGVNDNAETLAELMRGLTRFGIAPYYVFQCRPVSGVKGRFQVPLQRGCELVDAAKSKQNGFGKCFRYAMSHPLGKIEILGQLPEGGTVFKFHQNKFPEDSARIFVRSLSPTDTWLDPDLNGI
jgi:KamA family protein